MLSGSNLKCQAISGLVYMHLRNGKAVYAKTLSDGRVLSFVGASNGQPPNGTGITSLLHVRVDTKGSDFVSIVSGKCRAQFSEGGTLLHVTCDATDEDGSSTSLDFVTDREGARPEGLNNAVIGRSGGEKVGPVEVARVKKRFETTFDDDGSLGLDTDVSQCYAKAESGLKHAGNIDAIRECMLYDMAAHFLDEGYTRLMARQGAHLADSDHRYMTARAFDARMSSYLGLAFGGSSAAARKFFGNAPAVVAGAYHHNEQR